MEKIEIKELPRNMKISEEEMKKLTGGFTKVLKKKDGKVALVGFETFMGATHKDSWRGE